MNTIIGKTVKDKITGFNGIVVGRVEYMTGCNQCLVQPPVSKDGAFRESMWLDEQKLIVDEKVKIVTLNNGTTPGFDKAAPRS